MSNEDGTKIIRRRTPEGAAAAASFKRAMAITPALNRLTFNDADEVRALLDLGGPGKASCAEVRTIAARHLEEVRAKIADLRKLERLLAKTIARCSDRKVPDCPVIDILEK